MNEEKKNQLIESIKTADGLTDDQRSFLLELLREKKPYGLVWEDKPENVEEKLREKLPVLVEDKDKALTDGGPKAPNHVLIEGDNLEALTTLAYTHAGKIDFIYIDPPYNTGNKDFVYNDSFIDSENAYRHSMWLSFMAKRLKIAKRLMSERGVIFISIDDNEQANLKLLCDSVFGENNFIAKFDWRKKTGANDAKDIAVVTESILLYANNRAYTIEQNIWNRDEDSINVDRYRFEDEFLETRGRFYYDTLDRGGLQYSDSMNYGITAPDGGIIYPHGRDKYVNDGWIWKWSKEKVTWGIKNKFIIFEKSNKSKGSSYTIKYKVYQYVDNEGNIRKKAGRAYMNLITEPINQVGNSEMKEIFNDKTPFSNPKPVGLIRYLLKTVKNKESFVLDFFAGSGTTLNAVMKLNEEDGGHRRCILVTNNENGICENVTYERNKRVINGYITPKGDHVEGLHENNLRYYRSTLIDKDNSHSNRRNMLMALTDVLCFKEDIYHEEIQFGDLSLSGKSKMLRYFAENDRKMLIIYDSRVIRFIVNEISKQTKSEIPIKIFIYADGMYPYTEDFKGVLDKIELIPMPYAFTHAIKGCIPDAEDKRVDQTELSQQEQENLLTEAAEAEKQDK